MQPGPRPARSARRGFDGIEGQAGAVGTLQRAIASDHIAHAYRFEGPDGVGKELAAFALAQALMCTAPSPETRGACGECSACTRAVKLTDEEPHVSVHPDVLLVGRGLYPAATIGRSTDELREISVDQIRTVVLSKLAFPPHEGRARIVIVRAADEMSISAANALLKTLEEPPTKTHFVLLTTRGGDLLDTIRSRTQLIRFAPLSAGILRTILESHGVDVARIDASIELANGSASAALHAADDEASRARTAFVDAMLAAITSPDLSAALTIAKEQEKDRDEVAARLAALANHFARVARASVASGAGAETVLAERFDEVQRALRELDRNASIALVIESLVQRLRGVA